MNLCSNAIWAMNEKGTIEITLHQVHVDSHQAIVLAIPEGKYLQLSFSDTGHGMNDETKSQIFDPFFTQKNAFKIFIGKQFSHRLKIHQIRIHFVGL